MNKLRERIIQEDDLTAKKKIIYYLIFFNLIHYTYIIWFANYLAIPVSLPIIISCMCFSYYSGVRKYIPFAIYIVVVSLTMIAYTIFALEDNTVAIIIGVPIVSISEVINYIMYDILHIAYVRSDNINAIKPSEYVLLFVFPLTYLTPYLIGRYHRKQYDKEQADISKL